MIQCKICLVYIPLSDCDGVCDDCWKLVHRTSGDIQKVMRLLDYTIEAEIQRLKMKGEETK